MKNLIIKILNLLKSKTNSLSNKLKGNQEMLKIVKNIFWLFLDKISRMGLGIFVGVWLARYLKPESFGLFNYAQAFIGIFGIIASLGLSEIIVRDIVKKPEQSNEILGTSIILRIIGGIIAYITSLLIIFYIKPNDISIKIIVSILGLNLILQSSDIIRYWFESQVQSKYVVIADNTVFFIITVIKIILIVCNARLYFFVFLSLFESILTAIALFYMYKKNALAFYNWRFNFKIIKNLLNDSWPLILSGIAISVFMKIDQIMLGQMIGNKSVGIYSAAVKISEVWYFIPSVVVSSFFPTILSAKLKDEALYYKKLQLLFDILIWFAIFVSIIMTFFSDTIINLLYGSEYSEAGNVLKVHIWTGIAVSFGIIWSKWILIENKLKMIIIFHVLAMIINILYNYYFIPTQGVMGAAIATAFASITAQLIGILFYKRKLAFGFLMNTLIPIHLFNMHKKNDKNF